ncbi:hypothetical protein OHT61_09575 [Streptomyces sp. NBC_00178]|uniref:hypothetical protein n=1 Tax=Streptomyces sp. NBC_00178 TaxID=2975672 RepID=UPI002E2BE107|nr:hypothetical protein [Streptomyces sp. NBC_00178]
MSQDRTDTSRRPQGAEQGDDGSGKHRGGASADHAAAQPHGRHRRPAEGGGSAAA